jgi:hypothetical protein
VVGEGEAAGPGGEAHVLQHGRGGVAIHLDHRLALLETKLGGRGGRVIAADAADGPDGQGKEGLVLRAKDEVG